nr:LysR family transcriptional regulator [Acetobacter fallax]
MKVFLAIADHGGFTAAARYLGRTQSAVSLRIRKLEALLGRPLFLRNAHVTELTPAGELLAGRARDLIARSRSLVEDMAGETATTHLRLGLGEVFVPAYLTSMLARFRVAHPRIVLEIVVGLAGNLLDQLQAGQLDLVLANREEGQSVPGRIVWAEPLHWLAARDYVVPASGEIEFVSLPPSCRYRGMAVSALQQAGRSLRVVFTSTSIAGIESALEAGWGIALLGRSSLRMNRQLRDVGQDLAGRSLSNLPSCELAIFGEGHHDSRALRALVHHLEDALQGDVVGT